jgi:hypothetical protein
MVRSEDGRPVVLDADDRPSVGLGAFERVLRAGGVVELAFGVVVQDEELQCGLSAWWATRASARRRSSSRPRAAAGDQCGSRCAPASPASARRHTPGSSARGWDAARCAGRRSTAPRSLRRRCRRRRRGFPPPGPHVGVVTGVMLGHQCSEPTEIPFGDRLPRPPLAQLRLRRRHLGEAVKDVRMKSSWIGMGRSHHRPAVTEGCAGVATVALAGCTRRGRRFPPPLLSRNACGHPRRTQGAVTAAPGAGASSPRRP